MSDPGHQQSDVVDALLARHPLFARVTVERWVAQAFASHPSSRDPGDVATAVQGLLDDRLRYLTEGEHQGDLGVHGSTPGTGSRVTSCAPRDRQDVPARADHVRTGLSRFPGASAPSVRSVETPSSWSPSPSHGPRSVVHRLLWAARTRIHDRHG